VRKAMAHFSKFFFGHSDEKIKTIGVTGTNGKTTVAAYVRSLLTLLGLPTGSIGTTGIWSSEKKLTYKKSTPTTPESIDLHRIFHDLLSEGDKAAVAEVSSIGIDQQRVEGILFDVAIHTNLSEEHLEYHKTFEHYKQAKLKLFDNAKHAVINVDDKGMGQDILDSFRAVKMTYSLLSDSDANIKAQNIQFNETGATFDMTLNGETVEVNVPVFGDYNIANVLAAVGTAVLLGCQFEDIIRVLPYLENPEGRFQVIKGPDNQRIILDYAHTPVALSRFIEEVKKLDYNRLIVMIAGIGIRDFDKMPKMAHVIEGKADEIVVTVDHPGYHDPQDVIDQVMTGFSDPEAENIHPALTRAEGVNTSLSLGQPNDLILLTSGCINGAQLVKGEEIPHSDEGIIQKFYQPSCK
jgi:UDP-N-acetylmuramoyl-L-alanyl-D-glutamate--2,6-diaminopimelate ligase